MQYKVKLDDPISNQDKSTSDGYLANWIDKDSPALYSRGEAIKKASAFGGGQIELVTSEMSVVDSPMIILSANDLLFELKELMKFRDLFGSSDSSTKNSFIYKGTVFLAIFLELQKLEKENEDFKIKNDLRIQLNYLVSLVTTDYILIKDMCFS